MNEILLKRKAVFFNNLLLLGLHPETLEEEHRIIFHKDMFNLPNKKGYEVVTHFLFSKLSAATGKDYNVPWPLLNKELERTFQKTCYSHLVNFSQESVVKFPNIVPSLLATVGGDRFYKAYLAFSSYVLYKKIRQNSNIDILSRPHVTQGNCHIVKEIVQLSTISSKKKFVHIETAAARNDLIWIKFAKNLSGFLQKLKQLLKINKELIHRHTTFLSNLYSTGTSKNLKLNDLVEKGIISLNSALRQRKVLKQFLSTERELWPFLASEVGENVDNEVLDGQYFNIDVIEDLPEKMLAELRKVGFSSSMKDGKTSVTRFLQLLMAYLKSLADLLSTTHTSDLQEINIDDAQSCIEQDLLSVNCLIKKMSELIPEIEESIRQLKLAHSFEDTEKTFEAPLDPICSRLVRCYTREAIKERACHIDPNLEEKLRLHSPAEMGAPSSSRQNLDTEIRNLAGASNNDLRITRVKVEQLKMQHPNPIWHPAKGKVSKTISCSLTKISLERHPPDSVLDLSTLDETLLPPSVHFNMRESWLQEESLNKMTLPDLTLPDIFDD